ncbi:MAG: hypothetical protein L0Z53_22265 [Acidobacteriales bacterium]|nr:hypothetical protein [Terriglobales bacterium]
MPSKHTRIAWLCASLLLGCTIALAQSGASHHDHGTAAASDSEGNHALDHTTQAMSAKQIDAGPHMKLTALRTASAQDKARAEQIASETRKALERYKDHRVALGDGYEIFLPNVPSKMKHFTNYRYAREAAFRLNPERPTSLLYEQKGNDYRLIGAMFTAPARLTEDELNQRIPLSVAQWHLHVNLCLPPREQRAEMFRRNAKFGLAGSIATREACDAAGGRFLPRIFGWMVHLYPFEKSAEEVWSVERQMDHKH